MLTIIIITIYNNNYPRIAKCIQMLQSSVTMKPGFFECTHCLLFLYIEAMFLLQPSVIMSITIICM